MSELDVEQLLQALDNDENESMIDLTTSKIKSIKNDMLQKLQLPKETLKNYHKKLKDYRYVGELHEIRYGAYIRWINLKNIDNIRLTNGGIICDIQVTNTGLWIKCKNNMNRFFQLKLDECLIFQKLSDQERILLKALDYLQ
jgi:hypothetical protein